MKKLFTSTLSTITALFVFGAFLFAPFNGVSAQCPGGYTQAQLNWDYLDYLISGGSYSGYVTNAQASTQRFTIGTNLVSIAASTSNFTLSGENTSHTGDLANYTGSDVQYTPTASGDSVVITFDQPVMNPNFTLYDIDRNAVYTISARDASGAAVNVTVGFQAITILTLGGTPAARTITASNISVANNSNDGSATISFPGLTVKTIKTVITNMGSASTLFWLSDINACVTGSFPSNYRNVARPFTGMPSYVITVVDSIFLIMDPATGRCKHLFTDFSNRSYNSLGYDPVNRILYYTKNRSGAGGTINPNNKTILKYTVDNETLSTAVADVTTAPLSIPVFDVGVESAAASFYNGSFYFGIEGPDGTRTSGRENIIWKIDFDGSLNAIRASQVYGVRADSFYNGADRLRHDWGDAGVAGGILYDFDITAGDSMYYHFNLMTGQRVEYLPSGAGFIKPSQTAIDWQDIVYNTGPTGALSGVGFVVPYNYNGTVNSAQQYTLFSNPGPTFPAGNWADAGEAFRPTCDFGDAPASYDPDPLSPAVHEKDTAIKIGTAWDREWLKMTPMDATGDGSDEDGLLGAVPIFSPTANNYLAQVSIYNNTGENATLIAWLDFNGNGVFDSGEACQAPPVVTSMASAQNRYLYWPSAPTLLTAGSYTYLRIRLVRASSGMTNSNPTGYYSNGETEDYRVLVDNYPLKANLLSFDAKVITADNAQLTWNTKGEENFAGFEIQRSADNTNWISLGMVNAKGNGLSGHNSYTYNDLAPLKSKSYYRLKLISGDGKNKNSEVRTITIKKGIQQISISPNPAKDKVSLFINSNVNAEVSVNVSDINGKIVYRQSGAVKRGVNNIDLAVAKILSNGTYIVRTVINDEVFTQQLIINKN
jgi:GEVED domain/Secretion system C-terminal sorting domain